LDLICTKCGGPRALGRRVCCDCHKKDARERAKQRYLEKGHTIYHKQCAACGDNYISQRKGSRLCQECNVLRKSISNNCDNNYEYMGWLKNDHGGKSNRYAHRELAESILGRKLKTGEVVHHIDGDNTNNITGNLLVVTRSAHSKLHEFLKEQVVVCIKQNKNFNIISLTELYFSEQNISYIKLSG